MIELNPVLAQGVVANLAYLHGQLDKYAGSQITELRHEQDNFYQAVQYGLAIPSAQETAARLTLRLLPLMERIGAWNLWANVFKQCLERVSDADPILHVRLLNGYGQLLRLSWRLGEAVTAHEAAAHIARQLPDPCILAQAYFHLSEDFRYQRAFDIAATYGEAAANTFGDCTEAGRWQAAALHTLGLIAQAQGDLKYSENRLQQAVLLWRSLGDAVELARTLNSLGITLQGRQQFTAAQDCYEEAVNLLSPTPNDLDKMKVQNSLGMLLFEMAQYSAAERAFRGIDTASLRQSGDFHARGALAQNLGNTLVLQGRYAEAEPYLRRAVLIWQQIADRLMLANSLGTLAEALEGVGDRIAAQSHFQKALGILADLPQNPLTVKLQEEFMEKIQALVVTSS